MLMLTSRGVNQSCRRLIDSSPRLRQLEHAVRGHWNVSIRRPIHDFTNA